MIEDLLMDFDEMGFAPVPITACGINPEEYARKWKSELVSEIERLKAENERVLGELADVLMCIKNTTEIDVSKLVKQAKIDVLNELKEKIVERMGDREYMGVKYKQGVFSENEIDQMIKELIK